MTKNAMAADLLRMHASRAHGARTEAMFRRGFSMKRVIAVLVVLVAWGLRPTTAAAATIVNLEFCDAASNPAWESSTCPLGVGAFLKIDSTGAGNLYDVKLTLDTTSATTVAAIKQVQFTIGGVKGDSSAPWGNYEAIPTLDTTNVDGGGPWNVHFSNINNGAQCSGDKNNSQAVCSAGTGSTDTGDVDIWLFHINLDDNLVNPITANNGFNLRAQFLNAAGGNGGILSPDGASI